MGDNGAITRNVFLLGLLGSTVLGAGLRLYRLGDPSVWADELFNIRDGLHYAVTDLEPGFLPTHLALLARGFGELGPLDYETWLGAGMREWDMRIGTALVGALSIPLLAAASARVLGYAAAALLALLLAVGTWHLEWSQNSRFYVPMFLYYNLALALYFNARLRGSLGGLALSMLCALLAMRAQPTSLMLFGVIGLDVLWSVVRQGFRSLRLPELGVIAAGAAIGAAGGLYSWTPPLPSELLPFLEREVGLSPLRVVVENAWRSGLSTLIFAAVGAWTLLRSGNERLCVFLVGAVAVPVVTFAGMAPFFHVEVRYTFVNYYGWLALAAVGIAHAVHALRLYGGIVPAGALLALVVGQTLLEDVYYYESGYGYRARFREAFEYVKQNRQPGEPVYTVQEWVGSYYLGDPDVLDEEPFSEPGGRVAPEAAAWLVVESQKFEGDRTRPHYLDDEAAFRAVFPTRIPFPQYTVRVYHAPPAPATP